MAPSSAPLVDAAAHPPRPRLHILYGSQTGTCGILADHAHRLASALGYDAVVAGLDTVKLARFPQLGRVLVISSTYGEGEMPDNAEMFWRELSAQDAPRLDSVRFAVLALGDRAYDNFCQAGRLLDTRIGELGAERAHLRLDCDTEFEEPAERWIKGALTAFAARDGLSTRPLALAGARSVAAWTRKQPCSSALAVNRRLSRPGSAKEVRHYEFELADSGITYTPGDSLGVLPRNDPVLVASILDRVGEAYDSTVNGYDGALGDLLTTAYDICAPSRELVQAIAERGVDAELSAVAHSAELGRWLRGRDVLDLLRMARRSPLRGYELIELLRPQQHRAYSIASSPLEHPGRIHLTVATIRYQSGGRARGGVCSTFLADRLAAGEGAEVFPLPNSMFRLPTDGAVPVVMVGPGTGIAPFRAFLQERRASGASGKNWLLSGDQHRAVDFLYEDELDQLAREGVLTRLDMAFSRDQSEKIYVQHLLRRQGKELYAWLHEGGHLYVCGDAARMAGDVDRVLQEIVRTHGALSPSAAADYVSELKRSKRYVRDVY